MIAGKFFILSVLFEVFYNYLQVKGLVLSVESGGAHLF